VRESQPGYSSPTTEARAQAAAAWVEGKEESSGLELKKFPFALFTFGRSRRETSSMASLTARLSMRASPLRRPVSLACGAYCFRLQRYMPAGRTPSAPTLTFESVLKCCRSLALMWISEFIVCWSLPIIVPVTAANGRSHIASKGLTCSGLVQIAFWSRRIRFGVPRKVIGAGFGGSGGAGMGLLCGSGASGSEVEVVALATAG